MPPALTRRLLGYPGCRPPRSWVAPCISRSSGKGSGRESFSPRPAPTGPCQLAGIAYWPREALKGDVDRTWASFAQEGYGLGLTACLAPGPYYTGRTNTCGPCAFLP